MHEVAALLAPINATNVSPNGYETDTGPWAGYVHLFLLTVIRLAGM